MLLLEIETDRRIVEHDQTRVPDESRRDDQSPLQPSRQCTDLVPPPVRHTQFEAPARLITCLLRRKPPNPPHVGEHLHRREALEETQVLRQVADGATSPYSPGVDPLQPNQGRKSVVFPAPFGPRTPVTPIDSVSDTSSSAVTGRPHRTSDPLHHRDSRHVIPDNGTMTVTHRHLNRAPTRLPATSGPDSSRGYRLRD